MTVKSAPSRRASAAAPSLARGIIGRMLLANGLVLAAAAVIIVFAHGRSTRLALERQAADAVLVLEAALELPFWQFDEEAVRALGRAASSRADVDAVIIYSFDGAVSFRWIAEGASSGGFSRSAVVKYQDRELGYVEMVLSSRPWRSAILGSIVAACLGLAAGLAAATLAVRGLVRRFVELPLARLGELAQAYASGRFSSLAPSSGYREVLPLEESLAEMGRDIGRRLRELEEATASLERALAAKENLLREVHHRVKNNLQILSALISTEADAETDESLRARLSILDRRVQSIAELYDMCSDSAELGAVVLGPYLEGAIRSALSVAGFSGETVFWGFDAGPTLPVDRALVAGLLAESLAQEAADARPVAAGGSPVHLSFELSADTRAASLRMVLSGAGGAARRAGSPQARAVPESAVTGILVAALAGRLSRSAASGDSGFELGFPLREERPARPACG